MNRRTFLRSGTLLLVAGSMIAGDGLVSAHEPRNVGGYNVVVGFLNEPAIQGQLNAAIVTVTQPPAADATPMPGADEAEGTPVKGLELTVEVIFQDQNVSLPMEARFDALGSYVAYFIPTQPGDYSFRITGEIDGQAIDETFTAGPETFASVAPRSDFEFPKAS